MAIVAKFIEDDKHGYVYNWQGRIFMQMPIKHIVRYIEVDKKILIEALGKIPEELFCLVEQDERLFIDLSDADK